MKHSKNLELNLQQVCSVCLCDIDDTNTHPDHSDMCEACGDYYDTCVALLHNLQIINAGTAHTFTPYIRIKDGVKGIRCPRCGAHAQLRDISGRICECKYCNTRYIKLNNSVVEVYDLRTHRQIEYLKHTHEPLFDRKDGSIKNPKDLDNAHYFKGVTNFQSKNLENLDGLALVNKLLGD